MRPSRTWSLLSIFIGVAVGVTFATAETEAQTATYCERDVCINWTTCWDDGVLPLGCDMVYGSPQCQTYFCGEM